MEITRRNLLASTLAAAGGVAAGGVLSEGPAAAVSRRTHRRPNIVVILVDEMRFPQHFPVGVSSVEQWLASYMPNVHRLWQRGVKFESHYTAGTACSPSRASLVTGLYPHQNWCLQTRKGAGGAGPNAPALQRDFPTYGKLVREAGYITPYVGKWHLSDSPESPAADGADAYLQAFGFQGLTIPDPIGTNGQGTDDDATIASQAVAWLSARSAGQDPFCLTVSFVNPHDKEFFWAGTEADRYNSLYADAGLVPYSSYQQVDALADPTDYGYDLPQNWESAAQLAANKPSAQTLVRSFSDLVWGGVNDDSSATDYSFAAYPGVQDAWIAQAPYSYWTRAQDSYTQVQAMVDEQIGAVVRAIPASIRDNTIIVFTADHGDYSSSHGFAANKAGSMYEEAVNVPLIVVDPRHQVTGDTHEVRHQLTSSVDVLPMLATLAHGGRQWLRGDYETIYGDRLDLLPLLKHAHAHGRTHVLSASDEWLPGYFNTAGAPLHIMGIRTHDRKVAAYNHWTREGALLTSGMEVESYHYGTRAGRLELDNLHGDSAADQRLLRALLTTQNSQQMSARLPGRYQRASVRGKQEYLDYIAFLDALQPDGSIAIPDWIGNYFNPS